ncbi:MAG: hypothetical protein ACREQB_13495 [Candidatus Binataceae bacterium]
MTRFAACFLLVFGQLAFGGLFALAIPPFFNVERGFYKSSASVYLSAALATGGGLALLALRGERGEAPSAAALWAAAATWALFSIVLAAYLYTLWSDQVRLRAQTFAAALVTGMVAVVATAVMLEPAGFGAIGGLVYAMTALGGAAALGLSSGAMLLGHWYLIDPNMPVDYLRSFIRMLGYALVAYVAALVLASGLLAVGAGTQGAAAIATLTGSHYSLLAMRMLLGPLAALVLTWMCWQTLKVPQTMAATGLLYITVLAVLVGEMLGRYVMFRTAVPL